MLPVWLARILLPVMIIGLPLLGAWLAGQSLDPYLEFPPTPEHWESRSFSWLLFIITALAGLICGFFWEMWNYYSLSRWEYVIPQVHGFQLFEMPLLGYAGYLPFGLTCVAIVDFFLPGRIDLHKPTCRR